MQNEKPIGLFDSGIGGTSIWTEVNKLLPNEHTIYLADSKNAPYGQRTKQEIINLSFKNIDFLVKQGCKTIIVACNTATTNAITEIRKEYALPIIGIEPAIKPATLLTKTSKIGILATKGTITSAFFASKVKQYHDIEIYEQIGHHLVQLLENGKKDSPELLALLKSYINPMIDQGIDTLVLGCTHYPYLKPLITSFIPNNIQVIDSGKAVAKQTENILKQNQLLTSRKEKGTAIFYTNSNPEILKNFTPENSQVYFLDF